MHLRRGSLIEAFPTNSQVLNFELFYQMISFAPSETPIMAKTYVEQCQPFHKIHEEHLTIKGHFTGTEPVMAIDKVNATQQGYKSTEDEQSYNNPVASLNKDGSRHLRPVSEMKAEFQRMNRTQF